MATSTRVSVSHNVTRQVHAPATTTTAKTTRTPHTAMQTSTDVCNILSHNTSSDSNSLTSQDLIAC
jgi:hypothetical protein